MTPEQIEKIRYAEERFVDKMRMQLSAILDRDDAPDTDTAESFMAYAIGEFVLMEMDCGNVIGL